MRFRRSRAAPLDVTVAIFGDPNEPFGEGIRKDEWQIPYGDRLKVRRQVDEDATLGGVLLGVVRELGVRQSWENAEVESVPFVSFYKEGDENGFQGPFESFLPLIDQNGRVTFNNWDFAEITFGGLIRSAEATALQGDPLRPYLILHYEVGNGLLADWATVVNLWDLAWHVLDRIAIVGGVGATGVAAKALVDRLRDRTRHGRDAVAAHAPHWQTEQGLHPSMVGHFLQATPRTTAQIAGLLGCSKAEAEAVCWAFGLTRDAESGQWTPSGDVEPQLLGGNTDLIIHGYSQYVLSEQFEQRVRQAIVTGTVPRLPWEDEQERFIAEAELEDIPPEEQ